MSDITKLDNIKKKVADLVDSALKRLYKAASLQEVAEIYNRSVDDLRNYFKYLQKFRDVSLKKTLGAYLNKQKIRLEEGYQERKTILHQEELAKIDRIREFGFNYPIIPSGERGSQGITTSLAMRFEGHVHPLITEIQTITSIFKNLGFDVYYGIQLDTDYYVFEVLNIPVGHPAREMWDTFYTEENLVPTTHTSNMQVRILQEQRGRYPIAAVVFGKVFRNEEIDATHSHTFHQLEGIFVGKNIGLHHLLGVWEEFMNIYFKKGEAQLEYRVMPAHFPFVEPGIEISIKWENEEVDKWLEVLGAGMIHPKVLRSADIDPSQYTGIAFGMGIERLLMLKLGLSDIRDLYSGNIFLHNIYERTII